MLVESSDLTHGILTYSSQEDVRDSMATAGTDAVQSFSSLFEDERQSDVVLLVGAEGAQERIPAHSWVLGHTNDFFRSLLTGPLRDPKVREFYFTEDHPRGFRSLVRWLYGCGCSPAGTQSALDTLQVAIKYLAVDLVEHVFKYLSMNLNPENVLQIMAWGHQYTGNSRLAPSAPPAEEIELLEDLPPPYPGTAPPPPYEAIYDCDPTSSCDLLVSECFSLLDVKAEQVLASESLEEVSAPLLSAVLSRNTLGVTSEGPVLDALYRWSSAECRRQHRPLTLAGRRGVLGQMLTLPRLLTISASQLTVLDKLYDPKEVTYVTAKVKGDFSVPDVPPIFVGSLDQMAKRRVPPSEQNTKNKKNKQKNSNKKRFSTKQFMWDVFSVFAHMID